MYWYLECCRVSSSLFRRATMTVPNEFWRRRVGRFSRAQVPQTGRGRACHSRYRLTARPRARQVVVPPPPPSNPSPPPASSPLRRQNPGSFVFSRELTSLSAVPPLSLLFSSSHRLEASSLPPLSPSSRRHNLCFSLPAAEFLSIANFNFIVAARFSGE